MTNRQWLNTLTDEQFAIQVLSAVSTFHKENFNDELDIFDITIGTQLDFEEWLQAEHKEIDNG